MSSARSTIARVVDRIGFAVFIRGEYCERQDFPRVRQVARCTLGRPPKSCGESLVCYLRIKRLTSVVYQLPAITLLGQ